MQNLVINWNAMLIPDHALEMFLRGSLTYLGLLIIMRIMLKRQVGGINSGDILVTVLIADAIQNGMAGDYHSVPDGLILVSTIMFWDYFVDYLSFRFPIVRRFLTSAPLPLIKDGKLLRKNMKQEFVTVSELMAKLREEGVESPKQVKKAFLESEGQITVIKAT